MPGYRPEAPSCPGLARPAFPGLLSPVQHSARLCEVKDGTLMGWWSGPLGMSQRAAPQPTQLQPNGRVPRIPPTAMTLRSWLKRSQASRGRRHRP